MSLANEETPAIDFVACLPIEVVEQIFLHLEPKDLAAATAVNSTWRAAVNSNKVWSETCKKKGWKDIFQQDFTHFSKSYKQFREYLQTNEEDSHVCEKRQLFNKHSLLTNNWSCGNCVIHKITNCLPNRQSELQVFEPVTCYGRYLLLAEVYKENREMTLGVWDLNGTPSMVCKLAQPNLYEQVDAVAFDFNTIVIAQNWLIVVYHLVDGTFEKAYSNEDLKEVASFNKDTSNERRINTLYLKVTQKSIICVPASSVHCLSILFWNRMSGYLENKLDCNQMFNKITNSVWFGESCFLVLVTEQLNKNYVSEFGVETATWGKFSRTCTLAVERIDVNNQYVLTVAKKPRNNNLFSGYQRTEMEITVWSRNNVDKKRIFVTNGKGFQFIADKLMYFIGNTLKVENPIKDDESRTFELQSSITGIRASYIPNILVIKTASNIELWDWSVGRRLYTVYIDFGYGRRVWSDDKRIIVYNRPYKKESVGVTVLGFW